MTGDYKVRFSKCLSRTSEALGRDAKTLIESILLDQATHLSCKALRSTASKPWSCTIKPASRQVVWRLLILRSISSCTKLCAMSKETDLGLAMWRTCQERVLSLISTTVLLFLLAFSQIVAILGTLMGFVRPYCRRSLLSLPSIQRSGHGGYRAVERIRNVAL